MPQLWTAHKEMVEHIKKYLACEEALIASKQHLHNTEQERTFAIKQWHAAIRNEELPTTLEEWVNSDELAKAAHEADVQYLAAEKEVREKEHRFKELKSHLDFLEKSTLKQIIEIHQAAQQETPPINRFARASE